MAAASPATKHSPGLLRGDGEASAEREQIGDEGIRRELDRGHRALAGDAGEGTAAQGNDAGGVVERERAGDAGGGDLALAVSDDRVGVDAEGAPEVGEGDHDGEQGGLDDVDLIEPGLAGSAREIGTPA